MVFIMILFILHGRLDHVAAAEAAAIVVGVSNSRSSN